MKEIKIEFNGAEAKILNPDSYILEKLRVSLSYIDNAISYTNKFTRGPYQNPEITLLRKNTFLTGLLSRADYTIRNCGYQPNYTSTLSQVFPISMELPDYLYKHQLKIIRTALDYKRCIIQSPTGSGKTVALAHIIKHFPHSEVVVVVPEQNLMEQNAETIERIINEPVGRVSGKKKQWRRVTVGVINSLAKIAENTNQLANTQVLIVDECHRAGNGKQYNALSAALINTDYRIGLSATPNRKQAGDQLFMEAVLGPIALVVKEEELIAHNIIMQPHFFVLRHQIQEATYSKFNNRTLEYNTPNGKPIRLEVYLKGIVHNSARNNAICQLTYDYLRCSAYSHFPAMILVELLEHGQIIQQIFKQRYNIDVPYINGQSKLAERRDLLDQLRHNKQRVLIASRVFNEGQDVPSLGLGVIASGGTAENRVIQQVGRFIRVLEGKAKPIIVDFRDEEYYYLLANSRNRIKTITERFLVKPVELELTTLPKQKLFTTEDINPCWITSKL
jgi:superfamily II DNA or RNA helicase